MKQNLKNYLSLGIFLFGIFLINNSCTEDKLISAIEESGERRVHRISWEKFTHNVGISEDNNINAFFNASRRSSIIEDDSTPTILTDEILMIQKEDATHYTFKLDQLGENQEFYNLAIIVNNSQQIVESKVFEYIPDDDWLFDITQPFNGSVKIINGLYSLEETQNALSRSSSQRTLQSCIDSVSSYWECSEGTIGHSPQTGFPPCGGSSWNYVIDISWAPCLETGGSGAETDPTPVSEPSGDGTPDTCTTCGASGGNGNTGDGQPNNSIDTQPMSLSIEDAQDCNELKSNSQDPIFLSKLNHLKENIEQATSTTLNFESAYTQSPTDITATSYNYSYHVGEANGNGLAIDFPVGTMSGFFHTHYSLKQLSTFSLEDIKQVYELAIGGGVFDDTFTAIVITKHGTTYALKFDNPQKLVDFGEEWFEDWDLDTSFIPAEVYENKSERIRDKYDKKIDPNFSIEKNEKGMAKFLDKYDVGLSLYKSDENFANWEKINKNGTTTPCN